jgi:hypothetical protein
MVWLEIFGASIGGLVARSRPALDPSPQNMRTIYLQYCSEHPAPSLHAAHDYTMENADGDVLTASDADVGIIAHHAARLASDTLLYTDISKYPHSMYLIGLAEAWVFDAPFSTIPIATAALPAAESAKVDVAEFGKDNVEFLVALLEKHQNATSPTA